MIRRWTGFMATALALAPGAAQADNLYHPSNWSTLSADRKAMEPGDTLTVVVYQTAEATNSAKSDSSRSSNLTGGIAAGPVNESGTLRYGGSYSGGGQVQRTDRFVTQMTVTVDAVLPNGDLRVSGRQHMHINGETSDIGVRGRVRPTDIDGQNRILSSRIADAQIDYDGRGFVSRSAKPGLLNRVFRFLGLG